MKKMKKKIYIFFFIYLRQRMSQKTLDKWLGFKTKKKDTTNIKKFFYINWSSKYLPENAVWLNSKPENVNFEQTIKWGKLKSGFEFTLCGYFPDINDKYIISKEKKYNNLPYIKSHLQKAVRRMEDLLVLQTASHFIHMDIVAFLRRLPIIMIEDTHLNISFNNLIWLMVAFSSTKFTMKKRIVEYLLGVTYQIVTTKKKDKLLKQDLPVPNNLTYITKYNKLKDDECSLLYSLTLRKAYGGLKGDMIMIDKYLLKWYNRFNNNEIQKYSDDIIYKGINPIHDNMENLMLDKWILSAIDFHCSDIINHIRKKYDYFTEGELKQIIWHSLSCTNKRINQINPYKKEFKRIKEYIGYAQKYLLMCNH
jgi:hypothetical protein